MGLGMGGGIEIVMIIILIDNEFINCFFYFFGVLPGYLKIFCKLNIF